MTSLDLLVAVPLLTTPLTAALAWYRWRSARLHTWRSRIVLGGLIATSVNVLLSYGWLIYRAVRGGVPEVWQLKEVLGDRAMFVVAVAFVAAVVGKGGGRWPLALSAMTGLLLWVSYGFL